MRNINGFNFSVFFLICSCLVACETLDPDEPGPIFLKINSINVETDLETQGTASHNIFDATVYHNGNIVATVPIPARVPVLQDKTDEILIFPGVKQSGTSTNRIIYPFLDPDTLDLEFIPGEVYEFDEITLKYKTSTKFLMLEDFEGDVFGIQPTDDVAADFARTKNSDEVFEGKASLKTVLDAENFVMGLQTFGEWRGTELRAGSPVYLELNYKNDLNLQVGYKFASDDGFESYQPPFLYLTESDEWKKVYIDLTNEVSVLSDNATFKMYFSALFPQDSSGSATILIDNIKILTFE